MQRSGVGGQKDYEFDNQIIFVDGYEILIKIIPNYGCYRACYIYDTKIPVNEVFKEDSIRYNNEFYELITENRRKIEHELLDIFFRVYGREIIKKTKNKKKVLLNQIKSTLFKLFIL